MIDIHNHILYGIDDGAVDEELTLKMARVAADEGITDIIATPHHKIDVYENYGPKVIELTQRVNELLQLNHIKVKIHPSQEIRTYGAIIDDLKSGKALTLVADSPYVLVEFPTQEVPHYTERLFSQMAIEGYIPIIAHPERNLELQKNPNKLVELIELGALAQVTAGVVVGRLGKQAQNIAEQMITHNLIHFIASDAHNVEGRNFFMKEAFDYVEDSYGKEYSERFQENAARLLNGEKLKYINPKRITSEKENSIKQKKKKKFLGLF